MQGGEGIPAMLSCLVRADPPAKVHWEKNGMEIGVENTDRYERGTDHHYVLYIGRRVASLV